MDDGTPSAFGTSPKYDMVILYVNQLSPVVFGGGRVGAGVVARVEALQGRMGESTRQVEGLFESLLSESFG